MFGTTKLMTIKVQGMSCSHCEMRVAKAIKEFPNVKSVNVSASEGTAKIKYTNELNIEQLRIAVSKVGYKLIE
jgi:copper chaperone CopZ